jgi:hypothetical protein
MTQTTVAKKRKTVASTTSKSVPLDLPSNPFQHEILELACAQKVKAKKIEVLQKYANDALLALFIWNYDDSVISLLPDGPVPYSKVEDIVPGNSNLTEAINHQITDKMVDAVGGNQKTTLRSEYTKFYLFIKGGDTTLSNIRRETIFIQLLEGLHPKEAEIVCLVKDKKLTTRYNLPFALIQEAFPTVVWGGRS